MALVARGVEPGDPTLGEQAEHALVAGDIELAIELYAKWLEAVPSDQVAWYNYACALALQEREQEAVQAFDDAVTAGWRDSEWPSRDPDLAILHGDSTFLAVIERIKGLAHLEERTVSGNDQVHFAPARTLAPYTYRLPGDYDTSNTAYPVVVLLHGRGGDLSSLSELPDRLALPEVIYLIPRAPFTIGNGRDGFEYWPQELSSSGRLDDLQLASMTSVNWLDDIIMDARQHLAVDTTAIVLVGYSQGAAIMYLALQQSPHRYRLGAALGGYLPHNHATEFDFGPLVESGARLFLGHGTRDRVIEVERARVALAMIEEAGISVEARFYPETHDISDEMLVDLAEWIGSTLRERNAP